MLQQRGFRVGFVTDGRMSGASGKVPAAIHVTPECEAGGPLAKVRDGDVLRLDAVHGSLEALVPAAEWAARPLAVRSSMAHAHGAGRELFGVLRRAVGAADEGASVFEELAAESAGADEGSEVGA